jgi:hypothetical protein
MLTPMPSGASFVPQRLAEAQHRELARLVGGHADRRGEHARRRGQHDAPGAVAGPEQREEGAHRPDGAEHVDVQHEPPVVVREPVDGPELLHADVGAQHVAATEGRGDVVGRGGDGPGVADVDPERDRRHAVLRGDGSSRPSRRRLVDVEHGHAGARAGERVAPRGAQAGAAPGHDGDLVGEVHQRLPLSSAARLE